MVVGKWFDSSSSHLGAKMTAEQEYTLRMQYIQAGQYEEFYQKQGNSFMQQYHKQIRLETQKEYLAAKYGG